MRLFFAILPGPKCGQFFPILHDLLKFASSCSDEERRTCTGKLRPGQSWDVERQKVPVNGLCYQRDSAMSRKETSESSNIAPRRQAAADFSPLIESTEDPVWSVDPDFRLLTFNRATQRQFERNSAAQLKVGKRFEDLLPPEIAACWLPLYRRALSEGPFRAEVPFPDGSTLEVSFNPMILNRKTAGISIFGKDITDRKRAETEVREDADLLRDAQLFGYLGSYVLDLTTSRWTGSPVLEEIFGIGADFDRSVAGWVSLLHPDEREAMNAYFAQVLSERKNFDKEYRILRHRDRAERWVHGRGRLEFDSIGQPVKMRGIIKDITDRKLTELKLRESEERYRFTFEQAAVGIVHASFEGVYLRCNARFAEIIGYPAEEIPGMSIRETTLPEDVPESLGVLQPLVSGAIPEVRIEKRYVRKDGSITWVRLTASAQRDSKGRALHLTAMIEDINAHKLAELKLHESEERFRFTFEQAPLGIVHTSAEGRFLRCNARFAEIIGYPTEEVPGLSFQQITAPEDLATSLKKLDDVSRPKNDSFCWEKRYIRKDSSLVWVRITATAQFDSDGHVVHNMALIEDINALKTAEQALSASEERYRTAFQTSLDAININRLSDGQFIECNNAFLDMIGFTRQEVDGRTSLELDLWADKVDRQKMLDAVVEHGICRDIEAQFRKKNGDLFWGLMSASAIEIEGVPCVLTITRDITASKAAEKLLNSAAEAVRLSEERYRKVFHTSLDPITINQIGTRQYLEVNQAFLNVLGFERHEVIGKSPFDLGILADPRNLGSLAESLRKTGECRNLEIQFISKNGETVWGLMSASIIEIDEVPCVLSITRDITNAKAAEDEIRNLAFYDPLTGLSNRRLLLERLRQDLASTNRSVRLRALLFVDLDNFKTLNDTLGHQTGDLLLQETARRLTACVRNDDMVGRLGGDEFVVMLEDLSEFPEEAAAQAKAIGEKILDTVAQPYLLDGRECRSSASVGIAIFGDRQETINEVLQQADIAMYQAKAAGRNTMRFFAPALQAAVIARAAMEDDLRQALQTDQFLLYYQPQLDRNRLIGAEALIRWNHPSRNILPPGEFISLAEETGLILPLGQWVLEAACLQIAAWGARRQTARLSVAVNISARQFRQQDFVAQVLATLENTGADPRNLRLELTESMLVENIEEVIDKMKELKSHGLKFSLDDFGTGYSSLAYLKKMPLDQLKIDRSFIRDILTDESSAAIAQTIISLSRAMGLPVIAEGVETEKQREFLLRIGCHAFQGYLFSRPLPIHEFEDQWLRTARDTVYAAG
jgi:diguanylate cyclase (GGDEF)-like protein/PAS domain S-box-containing protein